MNKVYDRERGEINAIKEGITKDNTKYAIY